MILTMLASDRSTVTPLSPPPHQVQTRRIRHHPPANSELLLNGLVTSELRRIFCGDSVEWHAQIFLAAGGNFVLPLFGQGSNEFQAGESVDALPTYIPPRESPATNPGLAAKYPLNVASSAASRRRAGGDHQPKGCARTERRRGKRCSDF